MTCPGMCFSSAEYCTTGPPVSLRRPQIIYHAHGINVCTPKYDTLISTKYILSKTTAAASSSPLLSGRTKSASGPIHPHFATVRVISSSVASLSLSAEFLLMNSNRKNSTAVQSSESKSEKSTSKYSEYFVYTSYRSTNQKSSTTAVSYDTEFRIQIRKIVRYEV